jgi:hypothetical protein
VQVVEQGGVVAQLYPGGKALDDAFLADEGTHLRVVPYIVNAGVEDLEDGGLLVEHALFR